MGAGELIETCEAVCWLDLGLRLRMLFFELEFVIPIYRPISQKIDVPWAVDGFFWISANIDHQQILQIVMESWSSFIPILAGMANCGVNLEVSLFLSISVV